MAKTSVNLYMEEMELFLSTLWITCNCWIKAVFWDDKGTIWVVNCVGLIFCQFAKIPPQGLAKRTEVVGTEYTPKICDHGESVKIIPKIETIFPWSRWYGWYIVWKSIIKTLIAVYHNLTQRSWSDRAFSPPQVWSPRNLPRYTWKYPQLGILTPVELRELRLIFWTVLVIKTIQISWKLSKDVKIFLKPEPLDPRAYQARVHVAPWPKKC